MESLDIDIKLCRRWLHNFSAVLWNPGDIIEVRCLGAGEKERRVEWMPAIDLPGIADRMTLLNQRGWSVYVGANPRSTKGAKGDASVAMARSLFVDFDNTNKLDAIDRITAAGLPDPSVLVDSGHGAHCYWRFDAPVEDMAEWSDLQRDAIALLGTDKVIHNPERIMRVPGFVNQKPPPRICALVRADANLRYSFAELRYLIPERPRPVAPVVVRDRGSNTYERCVKYIEKCPDAISGSDGHGKTLRAACECFRFGLSHSEARSVMAWFNTLKTGGDVWNDREIDHKLRDAYDKVAAVGELGCRLKEADGHAKVEKQPAVVAAPSDGAAEELRTYLIAVAEGRIANVPWPWPAMTKLTQALIPGTVTCICGDPGVGKTFIVLDCLQFWHGNGIESSVFFIEKDRRFHTMRLLAQLEGRGDWVNYEWLPGKSAEIDLAIRGNGQVIDELGKRIHSAPPGMVTLETIMDWIKRGLDAGNRVLVVDPITAAEPGNDRWTGDQRFMIEAQSLMTKYGSSLVLMTHPKQSNIKGQRSGHGMAGGAAYFRFADCAMWLVRPKKPRNVIVRSRYGGSETTFNREVRGNIFAELHKTRDGRGAGMEIAFRFDHGLRYEEFGVVMGEARDGDTDDRDDEPVRDPFTVPVPKLDKVEV